MPLRPGPCRYLIQFEPKLEIGDTVPIKDGVVGVVVARFAPSGERRNEVHYVVELRADDMTVNPAERL